MKRNTGFAICDLVAVVTLLGIIISMLLPVIQETREAARQQTCQNRLRVLAMGAHVFHGVNNRLPSELSAPGAKPLSEWSSNTQNPNSYLWNQHTSVLTQITPFIGLGFVMEDADPIFFDFDRNLIDSDFFGMTSLWFGGDAPPQIFNDFDQFECPSDSINLIRSHATGPNVAVYNTDPDLDDILTSIAWLTSQGDGKFAGERTNYVGCFGASSGGDNRGGDLGAYRGAIGHREVRTIAGLADGSSNTVLFGENIGTIQIDIDGNYRRNFAQLWYFGANVRGRGAVDWMAEPPYAARSGISGFWEELNTATPDYPDPATEPDPNQGILGHATFARHFGFGSMHRNGVNFAFADGSVRTVGRTDDWQSLYAIFGAFDGDIDFDLAKPSLD